MRLSVVSLASVLLSAMVGAAGASTLVIKTATQDSAPKYVVVNGRVTGGICPDILRAIEAIDPNVSFTNQQMVLPFKRLEDNLWNGSIDMFCGYLKSDARAGKVTYVPTPIYTTRYHLAVRADDATGLAVRSLQEVKALGKDSVVLAMFSTAPVEFLRGQQLQVDEGSQDVVLMLNKLVAKRGRFAYYYDLGFAKAIEKGGMQKSVTVLPTPIQEIPQFIAFFNQADPAKVKAVSDALVKLRANGTLTAIYTRYID